MASHTDLKLRLDPTTRALATYRIDDPYRTLASPSQNQRPLSNFSLPIAESTTPITPLASHTDSISIVHVSQYERLLSKCIGSLRHGFYGNPITSVQLFEYIICCDSSGLFRSLALSASPSQPHSLSLTLSTSLCQPQSVSLTLTASLSQPYSHSLILSASLSQLHSLSPLTRTASFSQPHSPSLTLSASLSQPHSLNLTLFQPHSPSAFTLPQPMNRKPNVII